MNKIKEKNLNEKNNQAEQNSKENNNINNSIETKLEEKSTFQNEQKLKEVNQKKEEKQNLEQEEIYEKDELTKENPMSKDEFNTDIKKCEIKTTSELIEPNGKKENKDNLLVLNYFWIELLGSISLVLSIFVYEFLAMIFLTTLNSVIQLDGNITSNLLMLWEATVNHLGFKWLFFIAMSNHLSVGFFCLTTFSDIFRGTKHVIRFFIFNLFLSAIYYAGSLIILKVVIKDALSDFFHITIKNLGVKNEKVDLFFDKLIKNLLKFMAEFLSKYNFFLEKIAFGSMYIFLFSEPKCFEGKKIIYFRLVSIIPTLYIICSLIIRALYNFEVIELNVYISPLLLGPKITIYIFFISTLSLIKLKSLKEDVFDEEHEIQPKIFTKIGSRNFGIMGVLELFAGLFLPSWLPAGIGGSYLLVLCAPIMTLYDYKKEYVLKFPCCKKGNMSLCFKIIFLIISWFFIILIGTIDLVAFFKVFNKYLSVIIKFIKNYFKLALELLKLFIN